MAIIVKTAQCDAMHSSILNVECSYSRGFSGLQIIGNASEVCKNGLERAKSALEKNNIRLSEKKTIISLSPAEIRKDGSHFDLPIAIALAMISSKQDAKIDFGQWLFSAELGLSGILRPVKGIISFALSALSEGLDGIVIAKQNYSEVAAIQNLQKEAPRPFKVLAFTSLGEVLNWIFSSDASQKPPLSSPDRGIKTPVSEFSSTEINFDDMILPKQLEKVAVTCAAGMHSVLINGSPGVGKSMFLSRLPSILPKMSDEYHIESLKIHSLKSPKISNSLLAGHPPFRQPHHQSSSAAIIGVPEAPGEITLAHGGILFLDEFPEFRRDVLEALREPLERGCITVSRARKKSEWKSRILLVAACNPCPCGWLGSTTQPCSCPTNKILAYKRKISGPILDRIDIHINLFTAMNPSVRAEQLISDEKKTSATTTQTLSKRVERAKEFAFERNRRFGVGYNRELTREHILAASGQSRKAFLEMIAKTLPNSASTRSLIRSLTVARTLADLEQSEKIRYEDLATSARWQKDKNLPSSTY